MNDTFAYFIPIFDAITSNIFGLGLLLKTSRENQWLLIKENDGASRYDDGSNDGWIPSVENQ